MNRILPWFVTEAGKKFSFYAVGTASVGLLFGQALPHTVLLDQYRDFRQLFSKGFSVPITPTLQKRFDRALELCQIPPVDRHLFKPFVAYGFDVFSAGSSFSHFGVCVGLPTNFLYDNVNSVDKSIIKLKEESVPWDLDEAKALLDALVMSEKAQLYAMAREILYRTTYKKLIDIGVTFSSFTGAYAIGNAINTKLNLYARPLGVRLVLYGLVGAFSLGSWALCVDVSQVFYENRIDRDLANRNDLFVEGGREFYSKMLQRNKALRTLLGKEGERHFSVNGNENYFLRHKHIPLVARHEFFANYRREPVEAEVTMAA